jgi:hypothetical protein
MEGLDDVPSWGKMQVLFTRGIQIKCTLHLIHRDGVMPDFSQSLEVPEDILRKSSVVINIESNHLSHTNLDGRDIVTDKYLTPLCELHERVDNQNKGSNPESPNKI